MVTTIDKAGRIVIPAALRERLGLAPGTEIELEADELGLRLTRKVPPPVLTRQRGRLIARPTAEESARPQIDPADWVSRERDRWP